MYHKGNDKGSECWTGTNWPHSAVSNAKPFENWNQPLAVNHSVLAAKHSTIEHAVHLLETALARHGSANCKSSFEIQKWHSDLSKSNLLGVCISLSGITLVMEPNLISLLSCGSCRIGWAHQWLIQLPWVCLLSVRSVSQLVGPLGPLDGKALFIVTKCRICFEVPLDFPGFILACSWQSYGAPCLWGQHGHKYLLACYSPICSHCPQVWWYFLSVWLYISLNHRNRQLKKGGLQPADLESQGA